MERGAAVQTKRRLTDSVKPFSVEDGLTPPNTLLIINFEEWGGFYDHVAPPRAIAPNNTDPDLMDGKALLGFRVPCVIASPGPTAIRHLPPLTTPFSITPRF
jgi:phospholipase C